MNDAVLETLPVSHRLALSYAQGVVRAPTLALMALETRLSGILRQQGEVIIAQMKLAWWRDRFAEPPANWPLGEPLLEMLRDWPGELPALGRLIDGWEILLGEHLTNDAVAEYAAGRASGWIDLAGGGDTEPVERAARQFALADLAMHMAEGAERERVLAALEEERRKGPAPLPRRLRSLAVLRALALRAIDRKTDSLVGGPGAMALAMRVGITGR